MRLSSSAGAGELGGRAAWRLRRELARRAGRRSGRAAILLYHRVASPPLDPWKLAVPPAAFDAHLEALARSFRALPLGALARAARARQLPAGAVAVTFDDGYADNLEAALPALERHGVPATVFVATSFVGERRFWWDELDMALLGPGRRPARLELELAGERRSWPTTGERERAVAHAELQAALRGAAVQAIAPAIELLRQWAGAELREDGAGRPLSPDELGRLAASDLVEVGAHSRRHGSLASQDAQTLRDEVEGSRDDLEGWLGKPPAAFSYPFGDRRPRAARTVRRAGFELAVSTGLGAVSWLSGRYDLPRVWVEDHDPEALVRRLERLLAAGSA